MAKGLTRPITRPITRPLTYPVARFEGVGGGPVTGDITAATILATGWQSDLTFQGLATGGAYSLTPDGTPKCTYTITAPAFDATGAATTAQRTLVATRSQLQASPNEANPTEAANSGNARITLPQSDYIYASDTVSSIALLAGAYGANTAKTLSSGITNNSTVAYPKVIARWAGPPKELFSGDQIMEVVGFHQFGKSMLPLRCVKITGTPTTGSAVTKTVTSYTKSSKYGDNLPVYAATFSASTDFPSNGNADVTFTFEAFPWFGNSATVRDTSAGTFPSAALLAPQVHRTGTITQRFAYVDPVGGNDGTGVVSTTAGTASASSYATITAALTGLFAASSDISNCVLRLKAGTHTWDATAPTGATRVAANCWFVMEGDPADADPYNNVIVQTSTTTYKSIFNNGAGTMAWMKVQNLSLTLAATFRGFLAGSSRATLWLHHVKFTNNLTTADVFCTGAYNYATQCAATAGNATAILFETSSTNQRFLINRACTGNRRMGGNAILSCVVDGSGITGNAFQLGNTNTADQNLIMFNCKLWNWVGTSAAALAIVNVASPAKVTDVAIVQCLFEAGGTATQPLVAFGENVDISADNILIDYVTTAGGPAGDSALRINVHNDPTTNPTTAVSTQNSYVNFSMFATIANWVAVKDDVYRATAESDTGAQYLIQGWQKRYGVGWKHNVSEKSADDFIPDYFGLNCSRTSSVTYNNAGADDYRPTAGYRTIPAGQGWLPWDIDGTTRLDDGTGANGALEHV